MTEKPLACPTVLRLLISYDPETGSMIWRARKPWFSRASKNNQTPECATRRFNERYAGKPALAASKGNGYLYGNIMGKNLLAHRVAWCIFYGKWPDQVIDHLDGNRSNNAIRNLLDTSIAGNNRNRIKPPKFAHYGIRKSGKKWEARIRFAENHLHLGTFDSEKDAASARKAAEKRIWNGTI